MTTLGLLFCKVVKLVPPLLTRPQVEGFSQYCAEENIWALEGRSNRREEEIA